MAKKIEILENTLLKLLIRRGDDSDRQNVILSEGELGYTIDGKRLFVGDNQTLGGRVVGNIYKGSVVDHTTVTDAVLGDFVFNSSSNIIYIKTSAGWLAVAQFLEAGDTTIDINSGAGTIKVGTLSAGNLSTDIVGNSIELVSGRISLSSTQIKTDQVSAHSVSHLKLPGALNINSVDYTFPVGGLGSNQVFLGADANGDLHWRAPEKSSTFYFNSSAAAVPVGTVIAAASGSSMPTGWLICNGQSVTVAAYGDLHAAIGYQYGGSGANFTIPDYTNTVHVGTADPAAFTNSTLTSTGSATYTTKGVVYFIKADADSVISTTLSIQGGLTATKGGVPQTGTFSLLDGAIEIGTVIPGVVVYETATALSAGVFTTKATYTKFWITGSGAKGGTRSGGAAATVYGILSAPIGTTVNYEVAAGRTTGNTDGAPSFISIGGTELARSFGAIFQTSLNNGVPTTGITNTGTLSTSENYVLGGHIIKGGRGGWDTDGNGGEEIGATASFWGSDNVAGAGSGGHGGDSVNTADGLIKFEWGL
jgi:hypothetical protein